MSVPLDTLRRVFADPVTRWEARAARAGTEIACAGRYARASLRLPR